MDFLFELLVELCLEVFGDAFVSIGLALVPQKEISEKAERIIGLVCLAISLVLFFGLFVGIGILIETHGRGFWGWVLISLNIIYLVVGITSKIIKK